MNKTMSLSLLKITQVTVCMMMSKTMRLIKVTQGSVLVWQPCMVAFPTSFVRFVYFLQMMFSCRLMHEGGGHAWESETGLGLPWLSCLEWYEKVRRWSILHCCTWPGTYHCLLSVIPACTGRLQRRRQQQHPSRSCDSHWWVDLAVQGYEEKKQRQCRGSGNNTAQAKVIIWGKVGTIDAENGCLLSAMTVGQIYGNHWKILIMRNICTKVFPDLRISQHLGTYPALW